MIIRRFKPEQQKKAVWFMLGSAQLSFLLANLLGRLQITWLPDWFSIDFITGILTGYSVVANLFFLASTGKLLRTTHK